MELRSPIVRILWILTILLTPLAWAQDSSVGSRSSAGAEGEFKESQFVDQVNGLGKWFFNDYVRSVHDLRIHFQMHRKRVRATARLILKEFPNLIKKLEPNSSLLSLLLKEFEVSSKKEILHALKNLNQKEADHFFRVHDQAKILRLKNLRSLGYQGDYSFLVRLAKVYRMGDRMPKEKDSVRDELNEVDEKIGDRVLGRFNWRGKTQEKILKLIEQIADSLDRSMDQVAAEEYNRETQMSAVEWFRREPLRQTLCKIFQEFWKRATLDLDYMTGYMNNLRKHRDRLAKLGVDVTLPKSSDAALIAFFCGRDKLHSAKVRLGLTR